MKELDIGEDVNDTNDDNDNDNKVLKAKIVSPRPVVTCIRLNVEEGITHIDHGAIAHSSSEDCKKKGMKNDTFLCQKLDHAQCFSLVPLSH